MGDDEVCITLDNLGAIRGELETIIDGVKSIRQVKKDGKLVKVCGTWEDFLDLQRAVDVVKSDVGKSARELEREASYIRKRKTLFDAFEMSVHGATVPK